MPLPDLTWARQALERMSKDVTAATLSEITGGQANEHVCQQWLDQQQRRRMPLWFLICVHAVCQVSRTIRNKTEQYVRSFLKWNR